MPELVYNVRFEVDSSNLKKIGNIVDPNSSAQVQDLSKEIEELRNKLKNLKGGSGGKNPVEGASAGFLDFLQNVRTSTAELVKNTSTFKKSIVATDANTDSLINQSEALLDSAINLQSLRGELESLAVQENLTDKQTEYLFKSISQLANTQRTAVSASNNFKDGLQVVEHQAGTMNKAFSGSNQLLFSFGDLVQDSTQFTQGFAQGMRAIGNNVGFTAELFANLQNNVKRHNKLVADGTLKNEKQITTFEALKNSMKGAGGALIAINAVVLVSTQLFQNLDNHIKDVTNSAKAQAEALSEVAKSFSELDTGVDDPFGFRARAVEIEILTKAVGNFDDAGEAIRSAFGMFSRFGLPAGIVAKLASAFDDNAASVYQAILTLDEMDKQLKQTTTTHKAYEKVIKDQTSALSAYVAITKSLEAVILEQNTGIELTDQTLQSLLDTTQLQIDLLVKKQDLTNSELSTLIRLSKIQEQINGFIKENNKEEEKRLEQRDKILDSVSGQRIASQENMKILQLELDLLKESDEIARIKIQSEIERTKSAQQFNRDYLALKQKLDEAEVDSAQQALILKTFISEQELEMRKINAEQAFAIQKELTKRELDLLEAFNKAKRLSEEQLAKDAGAIRGKEALKNFKRQNSEELKIIRENRRKRLEAHSEYLDELSRLNMSQESKDFQRLLKQGMLDADRFIALQDLIKNYEIATANERTSAKLAIDKKYDDMLVSLGSKKLLDQDIVDQIELMRAQEKSDAMTAIDEQEKNTKIQNAKNVLAAVSFIADNLFENNKIGAIANAVMNTYEAATKALNATPFFAVNAVLAGATIAAGMAQVKKIKNTKKDGNVSAGGGTGGSSSSISSASASGIISSGKGIATQSDKNVGFIPSRGGEFSGTEITVINTFDDETVADVVDRGNRRRQMQQVSVS